MNRTPKKDRRYALLDTIRGLALVNMICYHGLWDLIYLVGVTPDWYQDWWAFLWQQGICWTFIFLSGFCWSMSHHPLKHGLVVSAGGAVVTAVTLLIQPEQPIWFGVLTLLGAAALLLMLLEPLLKKLPAGAGLAGALLLFALTRNVEQHVFGLPGLWAITLPQGLYQNMATAFLGFHSDSFYSSDYFPLLPWFFLFSAGYFLYRLIWDQVKVLPVMSRDCPPLSWLGRHSLLIYMAHQPVLFVVVVLNPLIQ